MEVLNRFGHAVNGGSDGGGSTGFMAEVEEKRGEARERDIEKEEGKKSEETTRTRESTPIVCEA